MVFDVRESLVFIPEWNENKDLPEAEQIKITICLPSAIKLSTAYGKYSDAVTAEFLSYVDSVEGLMLGKKKAEPIDILEAPGLAALVVEIKSAYRDYSAVDKKK